MGVRFTTALVALTLVGCGPDDDDGADASDTAASHGSGHTGSGDSGSGTDGSGSDGSGGGDTADTSSGSDGSGGSDGSTAGSTTSGNSTSGGNAGGVAFGEQRSGEATYYAATGAGACMFDPSPDNLMVAAINAPDWSGSAWCGACARIDGPMGTITVRIVDLCPECQSGDLDLSPEAFEQIAPIEQGRVGIDWTFVSCDVSGPVQYRYKDGTNPWWTAVQVLNHALPIASLEWSSDGVSFRPAPRQDYNHFLDAMGFGENPVTVRITAVDGQTLTDTLPAPRELLLLEGEAQFE
ncbi:MAG TPA: expansin EXLX1 family cellulose-binding protein [Polyangiaceae bacterium]|nr:expansin EXLX1 family cellulose-binding protein [Polyangiaceae bacterium]